MSLNPQEQTNLKQEQTSLKKVDGFLGSNILKFAGSVILATYLIGMWAEKIEQLPKEIASELIKQIEDVKGKQDKHELSDKYDKLIINSRIDNVILIVNELKNDIRSNRQKAEFIRPSTTELLEPEVRIFKKKR